ISNELYNLELDLGARSESDFDGIKEEVQVVRKKYLDELSLLNERDSDRLVLSKRVEDLLELSPREFEHYVGELFFNLGFEVEVTPYSNDQGIDIIMFKGHEKYGVQCKRYKGSVGSPDIQNFIGALDHLKADKGIFVTTGSFTFEAEKMASQHPIQLINRVDLANLIMESLKSASSNGLSFQENGENDNQMRFDF
ncbi:MAG: restriction endonuclease, partial [Muribaculaceae bacterium]|nr:restriction endonuclease [Muribaculaceae bacterium]